VILRLGGEFVENWCFYYLYSFIDPPSIFNTYKKKTKKLSGKERQEVIIKKRNKIVIRMK